MAFRCGPVSSKAGRRHRVSRLPGMPDRRSARLRVPKKLGKIFITLRRKINRLLKGQRTALTPAERECARTVLAGRAGVKLARPIIGGIRY
eukprot:1194472-Prorocentrum_minimum.AAC.4